jgi:hypothetical protein
MSLYRFSGYFMQTDGVIYIYLLSFLLSFLSLFRFPVYHSLI